MADNLGDIRRRIDALDERLVKLLSARGRLAQRIGRLKQGPIYRPEREAQVQRRVKGLNRGPLADAAIARVLTEVMSACRALEDEMSAAYLGPAGTFSQEAVLRHFGSRTAQQACGSIDEVFRRVETGAANYGVVPVENSTEGAVGRTLDLLLSTPLKVCGEILVPVHQYLMSRAATRSRIRKVYSHAQSLAQCQQWLNRNLPNAQRIAVVSNAEAARRARQDPESAALAGSAAAELYDLRIIGNKVQDEPRNTTRFLVLGQHAAGASGRDKTSLIVSTRNVPGAVHQILTPLAANGVSMTRLESRPAHTSLWEYVFFIDVEGHERDAALTRTLDEMRGLATSLKVLGSYPVATV